MPRRTAFSLIELLVSLGIVATLTAMLLPALGRAQAAARVVRCASNLHQVGVALTAYVAQSRGRYPPNTSTTSPAAYWYDAERVGTYLPAVRTSRTDVRPGGGAYVCPDDGPGEVRLSYAMNAWASSAVDPAVTAQAPQSGRLWGPQVARPGQMILVAEAYSGTASGTGWTAGPTVGGAANAPPPAVTTAAQRFGADGGVSFNARRWGKPLSELCYMRHRTPGTPGAGTAPVGRLNVLYADGHVAARTAADLVAGPRSTGDSWWSPGDVLGR